MSGAGATGMPQPRGAAPAMAAVLALALSACATANLRTTAAPVAPAALVAPAQPAASPGLAPAERLARAIDLLDHGQAAQARAELQALLAARADDGRAARLIREIDEAPQALLGARSFAYTVRPGETMSVLAERFLGDPLMFYALARYNGIEAPADVTSGRVLMIPGVPHRSAAPAAAQTPAKAAPALNPGQARLLRASALEAMSRGDINRAVSLLQHAAALDPGNTRIARDLARALRIQATVHRR